MHGLAQPGRTKIWRTAIYGSVSRWRVKEGKEDELEQLAAEVMNDPAPGSRAVYMYRADSDPREYWIAGVWESRDAYTSNSASPEQSERFGRLRALLDTDPEWHDGEIIVSR
jgi:heme-degrading monooxygenase HmoA